MPVSVIIQLSPPQQPFSLQAVLTVIGLLKSMDHICTVSKGAWVLTLRRILAAQPLSALVALVSAVSVAHGGAPTTAWHRHQIPLALGNGILRFLFRMRAKIIWNRLDFRVHPFFPVKVCQFRHHLPQR
jgi:hypothetical protein